MDEKRYIYTVTELTRHIRIILEDSFPLIWVEGEISNLRKPLSGHIYFTLKDENSALNAVIFRNGEVELGFRLEDGQKVICGGRITVYEKQGIYQLQVERIEPVGIGALQLRLEQLKKKLREEGLFDPAHKKPLPLLPRHIGVVTSPTGAAIRDILKVIKRRFYNLAVTINPVRVQGESAALEIAKAIEEFNRMGNVDVLIVGRGGGSLEDLWAFNEEIVARAIYNSKIPVISAVGHEIDWTIADLVADVRAPTPSAAAEMVVAEKEKLREKIEIEKIRLQEMMEHILSSARMELDNLIVRCNLYRPSQLLMQYRQAFQELSRRSKMQIFHLIEIKKEKISSLISRLENLSPLSILKRGYSLSYKLPERILLHDVSVVKKNDLVETQLAYGKFISKVQRIIEDRHA
ncbi:MAG: exodeoxyribonuclease VII large subunit [Candidatus Omnitrophica bacterium]|nr:exodeoxyribonuclease VII large subunit [Candidatus Omnitrophota bacterium]MCM8798220.1 exodeoxyribonuclease VII large subunit [Candidatus Omnitrophota bacterium]